MMAECIQHNGEMQGFVCAVEDVTDRRTAETNLRSSNEKLTETLEQLRHAQELAIRSERLGALGQMAAGVAHDINNALSPLLTYAELLSDELAENERAERLAELIRLGVSDMAATVRRLDHFYKETPDHEELVSADLVELAHQSVDLTRPKWEDTSVSEGKKVSVKVVAKDSPVVLAVPSQIRSVLTNLIFNSADAIETAGTVNILISSDGDFAQVEVIDDGQGMSQEILNRCLEPFYTSKIKGSGLGLRECHGIMRQHGGTITVTSEPQKGTTVTLTLPLSRTPAPLNTEPVNSAVTQQPAASEACILYVDDNESVRRSTSGLLESLGIQVVVACDGEEALQHLNEAEFQLVLSDYGLPGINGGELLQEIRRRWPELPVVIVSGWSNPVPEHLPQPNAYLKKPFRLAQLSDVVNSFLPSAESAL